MGGAPPQLFTQEGTLLVLTKQHGVSRSLISFHAQYTMPGAFTSKPNVIFYHSFGCLRGPGSSVGIATGYGLERSGDRNTGGGEIFRTCPDRPWGPTSLLYNGYRVFPGGKERPGRDADPSLPSRAVVMKG